jgi:hypothetical protein
MAMLTVVKEIARDILSHDGFNRVFESTFADKNEPFRFSRIQKTKEGSPGKQYIKAVRITRFVWWFSTAQRVKQAWKRFKNRLRQAWQIWSNP